MDSLITTLRFVAFDADFLGTPVFQDPPYDLGPLAVQLEVCEVVKWGGPARWNKNSMVFFVDLYGTMTLFRRDYGFIFI